VYFPVKISNTVHDLSKFLLQLQTEKTQQLADFTSTTNVQKNVINSDTPYINANLQHSEKVSETPYESMDRNTVNVTLKKKKKSIQKIKISM